MLFFSPRRGRLRFCRDLARATHVNISFVRSGLKDGDIPLHFSLRGRANGLVINTHRQGEWGVERWLDLPEGDEVEIAIRRALRVGRPRIVLSIGKALVFSAPVAEVEGLSDIDAVRIDGGIVPRSVEVENACPAPIRGHLGLRPRTLTIDGWGFRSDRYVQDLEIRADGIDRPIHAIPFDVPEIARREQAPCERIGILSVLPGWLGAACAPVNEVIVLRLFAGGLATGATLELPRDELRRRVELTAQAGADQVSRILAAEHADWLWPDLSASARRVAMRAARRSNLPMPGGVDMSEIAASPIDPLDAILRDTGRKLRAGVDPARALPDWHLVPPALSGRLALTLTGPFCARDAFPVLARWVGKTAHVLADLDGYRTGAVIPWLFREGREEEIPALLDRLHLAPGWQVETAALSSWFRTALDLADSRTMAVRSWSRVLARWVRQSDNRVSCRHMIHASREIVSALPSFDEETRQLVRSTLVEVYGMSGAFWKELPIPRDHDLATAQEMSGILQKAIETGERGASVSEALSWFENRGASETALMRLSLYGPFGMPLSNQACLETALADHADPDGAALRVLAHPFGPERDEGLARMARRAIGECYGAAGLPQAPNADLQEQTSRHVRDVLAGRLETETLLSLLTPLAQAENVHVGFGLGLTAVAGLAMQGRQDEAGRVSRALIKLEGECAVPAQTLRQMAPVRSARDTLSRAPGAAAADALAAFLPDGEIAPVLPVPPSGLSESDPVFDTLVCLVSCRANLDTRVAAVRSAWLGKLEALGIPHVVVVGDGDDTLRNGVLALDAPDDYDGLPDKSLALARWVLDRTPFAHLLKIDDDCFLDAENFFHGWSYRKFDYHGRYLRRVPGQMDRLWHARSGHPVDPDRSPEPSHYADGGSSYTLSRRAMAELSRQGETPAGQVLRLHSRMEDKLVGDLLALSGIGPVEEDHVCAIRRRPGRGCLPVPKWENGFFPSAAAPTRQIHLDRSEDMATAKACLGTPSLWPKKVWPADQIRLRYNSDTLELVSPVERLRTVVEAPVVVVCSLHNEAAALDAFLAHYRAIGVGGFLVADNLSDDGTLERLAEEPDVGLFSVDTDYDVGRFGVTWQKTLADTFRTNAWTLVADADELLACDTPGGLPELVSGADFADSDAVRVFLLDLYPQASLGTATLTGDPFATAGFCDREPFLADWSGEGVFATTPTWTSALRHRLLPGSPGDRYLIQKFALLRPKPWMRWAPGLHHMGGIRLAPQDLLMGHFKYHAGFAAKARREVVRGLHWGGAEEYRAYARLGEDPCLWHPEVSRPWREVEQVRRILDSGRL